MDPVQLLGLLRVHPLRARVMRCRRRVFKAGVTPLVAMSSPPPAHEANKPSTLHRNKGVCMLFILAVSMGIGEELSIPASTHLQAYRIDRTEAIEDYETFENTGGYSRTSLWAQKESSGSKTPQRSRTRQRTSNNLLNTPWSLSPSMRRSLLQGKVALFLNAGGPMPSAR